MNMPKADRDGCMEACKRMAVDYDEMSVHRAIALFTLPHKRGVGIATKLALDHAYAMELRATVLLKYKAFSPDMGNILASQILANVNESQAFFSMLYGQMFDVVFLPNGGQYVEALA